MIQPPTAGYLSVASSRSTAHAEGGLPTTGQKSRALPAIAAVPLAVLALPVLFLALILLLMTPLLFLYFQASFGGMCIDTRSPWADSHRTSWFSAERCLPGWEGPCCDVQLGYSDGDFVLRRIRNDEIEYELPYAGPRSWDNSSAPPDDLRGLWWMDQRLVHSEGIAEHVGYAEEAVAIAAADELVVSFSEGVWHPASRCVKPIPTYGGDRGHWTWFDSDGDGRNAGSSAGLRGNYEFCYVDDDIIKINLRYRLFGLVWVVVPNFFTTLTMERRDFGFSRVTRLGPDQLRRLQPDWTWFLLLPIPFHVGLRLLGMTVLQTSQPTYQYPLFRIVDGDGQRTRHYGAYLRFANTDTNQTESNQMSAPRNRGNGTSLVGVRAEYCQARNETCRRASEPPPPGSPWAVLEHGQCF